MNHFEYRDGVLHAEDVPLTAIARAVGTPVYVYSRATLTRHARVFREALSALPRMHLAFAVKSNPNLAVLKLLAAALDMAPSRLTLLRGATSREKLIQLDR